jgi:hypothetical protein
MPHPIRAYRRRHRKLSPREPLVFGKVDGWTTSNDWTGSW